MIKSIPFPLCQKVLPTVYDNSLSYYEQVCKLTRCCQEIVDELVDWSDTIAELENAIKDIDGMKTDIGAIKVRLNNVDSSLSALDEAIRGVNTYAHTLESRIADNEEAISNLIKMIANFNANVDEKLDALEKRLVKMISGITYDFTEELRMLQLKTNQIKVNLQGQIDELKERVDELDTSVVNPWRAQLGRISNQKNANYSYNDLADCVPTAEEYVKLGLTAQKYSDIGITAMDYVRRGKEKLHFYWVYSPTYGFLQEISNVLTSIVNFVANTLSASEYTSLDLTADEYSALDLTAQDYYSYRV